MKDFYTYVENHWRSSFQEYSYKPFDCASHKLSAENSILLLVAVEVIPGDRITTRGV